jgi:hypothetical protein
VGAMALRTGRIPRMRRAGAIVAVALVAGACGGRQDVYERSPAQFARSSDLTLPPAVPAAPAYLLTARKPLDDRALARLADTPGVAVAAPVARDKMKVPGESGPVSITVGTVRPLQYRAVAPPPARDADFVWLSLLSGNAVVTFDAAERLGVRDAGALDLPGVGEVEIGAFAENGAPENVADVLVSADARAGRIADEVHTVVVGAETGTVLDRLGRALARRAPNARLTRLTEKAEASSATRPAAPAAAARGTAHGGVIGAMSFEILKGGFIRPDPAWVDANISAGEVPVIGSITCHRVMFPQLRGALTEIQTRGLDRLIRPGDYGGCFVPRFIDRDPSKPLSMHAFGLAVDFNVSTNGLGTRGDLDPRIVTVFEKWGFEWGGRWSRPDPMHFELDRLLSP